MPYKKADERYIKYLEKREKRIGRPKREHDIGLLKESALAVEGMKTEGALKEREMIEAAAGRRLGREQDFARPFQTAEIGRIGATTGKLGAETAGIEYDTGFKRDSRSTIEDILAASSKLKKAEAGEAALSFSEAERDIERREEAEREASMRTETKAATPATAPEPGRKMRPGLKSFLWEGTPTDLGITLPGLGAPLYGYKNIADWMRHGAKKTYEYAFPRGN